MAKMEGIRYNRDSIFQRRTKRDGNLCVSAGAEVICEAVFRLSVSGPCNRVNAVGMHQSPYDFAVMYFWRGGILSDL